MSLLENLKQELIVQKSLLDQKGFTVNNANAHPSPTEITNTIRQIDFNLEDATANEDDVREGKTFYARTGELKTGTLTFGDAVEVQDILNAFISGVGSQEISLPTDSNITFIRDYAFCILDACNQNLFYGHNLTIPPNIKVISQNAFYKTKITGKLTISSTCTNIYTSAFERTTIEELEFAGGSVVYGTYLFNGCSKLKKATILEPVKKTVGYTLSSCTSLEEVYLPSTLTSFSTSTFYDSPNIKFIQFSNPEPISLSSNALSYCKNATILVPYNSYEAYYNSTNYRVHGNTLMGYGEFEQNEVLINSAGNFAITWHTSFDDATNNVNPVTICPKTGKLYGRYTAIVT